MIMLMRRLSPAAAIIEPSILSGTVVCLATLALLTFSNASFLINSGLLYKTLLGNNTSQDFIQASHDTVSVFTDNVFSNPALTKVLFFGFWMMIGLFAYISVVSIANLVGEAGQNIASEHYMHAQVKRIKERLLLRLAMRAAALLAICLWGWVILRFLLPFSVLAVRVGLNQISSGFYALLGVAVLWVSLHLLIVLLRLLVLRPRVFSSYEGF